MTLAELYRALKSKARIAQAQAQERATFDYINARHLAQCIGAMFSKDAKLPELKEVYPSLFEPIEDTKAKQDNKKMELSSIRFKQFAQSFNARFKEVASKE